MKWTEVPTSQVGVKRKCIGNENETCVWRRLAVQSEVTTCCEQSMEVLFLLRSGWDPGLGIEEWRKKTKDCLQAQHEKDGIGSCATGHRESRTSARPLFSLGIYREQLPQAEQNQRGQQSTPRYEEGLSSST